MKKLIIITLVTFLVPILASAASLSLSPNSQTVTVGDTFNVTIRLDTQGVSVDGVDVLYLNYNPALLSAESVTPGSLMSLTLANNINAGLGRITFSQVALGGQTYQGSGTLATISFKALSAGTANVTFDYVSEETTDSNVASFGDDVLSVVVNGSYSLSSPATGGGGSGSSGGGGGGGSSSGGGGSSSGSSGSSSGGSSSSGGGYSSGTIQCSPGLPISQIHSVVGRGSIGENVTNLQKFLVSRGYTTTDNITGYFGPITEAALKKFQVAEGIVSSGLPGTTGFGNAGPLTRARINSLIASSGSANCSLAPGQNSIEALKAQIIVLQAQVQELLKKLQQMR